MAIEEIVEELCWDEEEEGDEDGDCDGDGESGGKATDSTDLMAGAQARSRALAPQQLQDQPRTAECHAPRTAAAAADTRAAGVDAAAGQVTGGCLSRKDKRAAKRGRQCVLALDLHLDPD